MATPIVLPKLGNSVESCILVDWKVAVGDTVAEGDILVEVETDKAVMEVESTAAGTVLALNFAAGDDVPVLAELAIVGAAGETVAAGNGEAKTGTGAEDVSVVDDRPSTVAKESARAPAEDAAARAAPVEGAAPSDGAVSPRARHLAARKGLDVADVHGSGPGGRVIERDVEAALVNRPKLSPVAEAKLADGAYALPEKGSGPGGRVMAKDLVARDEEREVRAPDEPRVAPPADAVETIPIKGVRKVIVQRMLESMQTTAQLTLNASADARTLQALRARYKASPAELGLQRVTINDLLLFAVARSLGEHPELNALFLGDAIERHAAVHLGIAVDTPRGLMVPVVRHADRLSLRALSEEGKRLAAACLDRSVTPDELTGGTFTVTNLGAFGIESFTPVLNLPQVAILGVSGIELKAQADAEAQGGVAFVPHIGLSLTINHQVVDGAPAARFLQTLSQNLSNIDLLLAL